MQNYGVGFEGFFLANSSISEQTLKWKLVSEIFERRA